MLCPSPSRGLLCGTPKRKRRAVLTAFAAVFFSNLHIMATPLPAQSEDAPRIVIQEVAWAGSSRSNADEWIELANLGSATASVAGWSVRGAGTSGRDIPIPDGAEIPPYGTYLIANYAEDHENSALEARVALATSTVSISNSALGLELRNADGLAVDRAGDGTAPFAGSSDPRASMIRISDTNGDYEQSWTAATTSRGFKAGAADLGTPGFCDLCAVMRAEADEQTDGSAAGDESAPDGESSSDGGPDAESAPDDESSSGETGDDQAVCAEQSETGDQTDDGDETTQTSSSSTSASADDPAAQTETTSSADDQTASEDQTAADETTDDQASGGQNTDDQASDDQTASEQTNDEQNVAEQTNGQDGQTPDDQASGSQNTDDQASDDQTASEQTNVNSSVTQSLNANASPPLILRLNEAVSNPMSGPEWVELYAEDGGAAKTDRELELHDAAGKIATIPEGTPLAAPHFLIVALSSAKLNNGGDELTLRDTNGIVLDQTEIPQCYKGESWAKDPADGSWKIADTLTPGAQNVFPAVQTVSDDTTSSGDSSNAASESSDLTSESSNAATSGATSESSSAPPENQQTADDSTDYSSKINEVLSAALASNQASANQGAAVKAAASKNTNTTDSSDLTDYSLNDMFDPTLNEARVRVTGTVGSVSKLLGATHAFILLGEDGRGLIVYLPKHLNVPPYGSTVRVGGTLSSTYKGPELRMKKTDVWMSEATSTPPAPRFIDLLAPGVEDAWSLMALEGTVLDVKTSSFTLETDDGIEVTISVPNAVDFRVKRLAKQDRVRVTGLFDPRKDAPTVLPRTAEEIELLEYAEDTVTAASDEPGRHFPDWVPFAAAGGAIALTGASKRLCELMRKRKLKLLMQKAEAAN
jgi:hypothetical protein